MVSIFFTPLDFRSRHLYVRSTMSMRIAAGRIQQHRVRLGLSPEQYGIRLGVSGMTVRRVEAGYRPFRSTQVKFAEGLSTPDKRVEVDELFPGKDQWKVKKAKEAVAA